MIIHRYFVLEQDIAVANVTAFVGAVADIGDFLMSKGKQVVHGKLGSFPAVADDFVNIKVHCIAPDPYDIFILLLDLRK